MTTELLCLDRSAFYPTGGTHVRVAVHDA